MFAMQCNYDAVEARCAARTGQWQSPCHWELQVEAWHPKRKQVAVLPAGRLRNLTLGMTLKYQHVHSMIRDALPSVYMMFACV